jgi:hypothetical protein
MNRIADRYARIAAWSVVEKWTVEQAAEYCGISPTVFRDRQAAGDAPRPLRIPGERGKVAADAVRGWHTRQREEATPANVTTETEEGTAS